MYFYNALLLPISSCIDLTDRDCSTIADEKDDGLHSQDCKAPCERGQ